MIRETLNSGLISCCEMNTRECIPAITFSRLAKPMYHIENVIKIWWIGNKVPENWSKLLNEIDELDIQNTVHIKYVFHALSFVPRISLSALIHEEIYLPICLSSMSFQSYFHLMKNQLYHNILSHFKFDLSKMFFNLWTMNMFLVFVLIAMQRIFRFVLMIYYYWRTSITIP